MSLSQSDADFLLKRRQLSENWKYVGVPLLVACIGLTVYLWIKSPLLSNPFVVAERLQNHTIDPSTAMLAAVMLPIVTSALLGLAVTMVLLMFRAFAHERRLIAIVDGIRRNHERSRESDKALNERTQ